MTIYTYKQSRNLFMLLLLTWCTAGLFALWGTIPLLIAIGVALLSTVAIACFARFWVWPKRTYCFSTTEFPYDVNCHRETSSSLYYYELYKAYRRTHCFKLIFFSYGLKSNDVYRFTNMIELLPPIKDLIFQAIPSYNSIKYLVERLELHQLPTRVYVDLYKSWDLYSDNLERGLSLRKVLIQNNNL